MLERAVLLAHRARIDAEHIVLPAPTVPATGTPRSMLAIATRRRGSSSSTTTQLMRTAGGNVSLAAKLAQKTRKEIYDALKRLGLDATAYRAPEAAAPSIRRPKRPSRRP